MRRAAILGCIVSLMVGCQRGDPAREQAVGSGKPSHAPARTEPPAPPPPPARPGAPGLPDPLPGTRRDVTALVGAASRAAIGDFDGDGKREIALVDATKLRIVDPAGSELASVPVTRGIQVLVAADIDGDGHAELFAGWGQVRDHMDTKAAITVHRLEKGTLVEETVLAPETTRQDVVAIVPMFSSKSVLIAYFDAKYTVTSVIAHRGAQGWEITKVASLRTATSYASGDVDGDGKPDLVVGRVYGDGIGVDGDAFVLGPGETRTPIPTTRGLRSLAVVKGEIFFGDGWHQNYGANARGLLTRARHFKDGFQSELVEDTAGQYSIERILPASIDGTTTIVTMGSAYVRVFSRAADRWRGLTIAGVARDIAVGDLDDVAGDEILIVGDRSEIVSLHGVTWPP